MKIGILIGCVLFVLSAIIIFINITIDFKTTGIFQIQYLGMALVPLLSAILIAFVNIAKKSES